MFRCRRVNRRWAGLVAAVVCGMLACGSTAAAGEEILKLIPDDAFGFAIVRSVNTVDAKIGAFARAAGLPVPPVAESLGKMLKIDGGVDMDRPAAVVLMEGKSSDRPAAVLLIPTSDLEALVANWGPEKGDDDVWKVRVGPAASLCVRKGGYAVIAEARDEAAMKRLLAAKTDMVEETTPWHEWGAKQDLVVFVSKTGWKEAYRRGCEQMTKAVDSLPEANAQQKQAKAGLGVYRDLFKGVGAEVECFAVGLTVDDDAVLTVTNKAKLVEGGTLENSLKDMPRPPENMLVGLPNEPFVFAGAGTIDKGIMEEMMKFSFAMMKGMPGMMGGTDEQNKKLMELSMRTVKDMTGMGMVFGIPKEGETFLGGMGGVIWTKDADAYIENYSVQIEKMAELAKEVPSASWFKGMTLEKGDIEGIPGWKVSFNLTGMMEAMQQEPQAVEMMKRMYGGSGKMTAYFAVVGKEYVVYTYSPGMLKSAIAAIKDADKSLSASKEVATVADKLMEDPGWVGYLSPTGIIAMVNTTMKNIGQSIQLPDFPKTTPLGFAAKYEDGMFTKQLVIVPQTVKDVVFYGLMIRANPPKPATVQ